MAEIFSQQELQGIESRLFAEPLTAQGIVEAMASIKDKYLAAHAQPQWRDGPSDLWGYTGEVNSYLGRKVFEPRGSQVGSSGKFTIYDSLKLDLGDLLLLREHGRPRQAGADGGAVLTTSLQRNPFDDYVGDTSAYQILKIERYPKLFEQLEALASTSPNLTLAPTPEMKRRLEAIPDSIVSFLMSVAPDHLVMDVSEAVFNSTTKASISYKTF